MITKSEFDVLYFLMKNPEGVTQRMIAKNTGYSLGKINNIVSELTEKKLVEDGKPTELGLKELSPYKVKNAVIMAAGMSSRFAPLSYEKPKGLLEVKGEILIEREIEQLFEAGIKDITVVIGYMKEKFFYLQDKYGVKLAVNPDYYKYNNSSTVYCVMDILDNTYICSSDNYFMKNVFEEYVYHSYYSAIYGEGRTEEYCMEYDNHGRITNVTVGGSDSWYMLGHVYFDREFSKKFVEILKEQYQFPETKKQYWEDLYIKNIKSLDMYIQKYDSDVIKEFDSLEELREFDNAYINNMDSTIFANICGYFGCEQKDLESIKAIKKGLTNTSFTFKYNGDKYIYRHPSSGSETYVSRKSESAFQNIAKQLDFDDSFVYMDEEKGWKVSKYIPDLREMDYNNETEVDKALDILKKLHGYDTKVDYTVDFWDKTMALHHYLTLSGKAEFTGYEDLLYEMKKVNAILEKSTLKRNCLCHLDCCSYNFLLDGNNQLRLIDWEYSGMCDPALDIGTFISCSEYTYEEALRIIEKYLEHTPNEAETIHYCGCVAMTAYFWFLWALFQETRGNFVGVWLLRWFQIAREYSTRVIEMNNEL
ncbi:MAG: phosphotransferase [Saccharofermentans sp.]|nr:phosphotransferase [Saccharofermentans sp.]